MDQQLYNEFLHPSKEYSPMPFWFWNDELSKQELSRQIRDFKEKGVDGFVLHPRIGLPETLEYLSNEFMDYVYFAVQEANKQDMHVILYDEAMYPSGAANGKVVERNPQFASRGLKAIEKKVKVSNNNFQLAKTDRLVSLFLVRKTRVGITSDYLTCLFPLNVGIVHCIEQEDHLIWQIKDQLIEDFFQVHNRIQEEWSCIALVETQSFGMIRGIHSNQDDGESHAPRSADLLNPEAVRSFIEITHERYKDVVGEFFGDTVFAMFTDEPDMLGRNALEGLIPWTKGFEYNFYSQGNHAEDLLALFYPMEKSAEIHRSYQRALKKRLLESYYMPISQWCQENNLALTGHPAASDDIGLLQAFQIPGQDVVWRWVAPEDDKSLIGEHSTAAKCGADAARHYNRTRNINEFLGVCGKNNDWNLSAADMKWYIDWLAVRGVNLYCPHAFYYSVSGKQRSHERPPDVGPHNVWWRYYRYFSIYMKRLSWVMTNSTNQAQIAILTKDDQLPWQIAKRLYENQIEFNYVHEGLFMQELVTFTNTMDIANQKYQVVILDGLHIQDFNPEVQQQLRDWTKHGGLVMTTIDTNDHQDNFVKFSKSDDMIQALSRYKFVQLKESAQDIRVSLVKKNKLYFCLLVNEGELHFVGHMKLDIKGKTELWDPWSGNRSKVLFDENNLSDRPLKISSRSSVIIVVDPEEQPELSHVKATTTTTLRQIDMKLQWQSDRKEVSDEIHWNEDKLCSWTDIPNYQHFSGSILYPFSFQLDVSLSKIENITIDLGEVYEIAELIINNQLVDVKFWAPYTIEIPLTCLTEGTNDLLIKVTNNSANEMDQAELPSGLLGPVHIKIRHY